MPSVAVIVVTYRSEPWIRQCLDSVVAQAHISSVWVVDNASDDNTVDIVQAEYPDVKIIANNANVGFARANNQALEMVEEDYALLLNPDAYLEENAVSQLLSSFDEGTGMIGPRIIRDGTIEASICEAPSAWQSWLFLLSGMRNFNTGGFSGKPVKNYPWDSGVNGEHIRGACLMVSKAAWHDVGVFDERFFLYFEETEWCLRLRQKGWNIKLQPKSVVYHIGRASMKTESELPTLEFIRGAILFWQIQYSYMSEFSLRATLYLMAAVKYLLLSVVARDGAKRSWLKDVMRLAKHPFSVPIIYPKAKPPSFWSK